LFWLVDAGLLSKRFYPIGYDGMLALMANARGVITDSGTVVKETAVLQVPSVQMRRAAERPQVYDCGSSVKFDPGKPENYPNDVVLNKLETLHGKSWERPARPAATSEWVPAAPAGTLSPGHQPLLHGGRALDASALIVKARTRIPEGAVIARSIPGNDLKTLGIPAKSGEPTEKAQDHCPRSFLFRPGSGFG
jgi:hypothetical protein